MLETFYECIKYSAEKSEREIENILPVEKYIEMVTKLSFWCKIRV